MEYKCVKSQHKVLETSHKHVKKYDGTMTGRIRLEQRENLKENTLSNSLHP